MSWLTRRLGSSRRNRSPINVRPRARLTLEGLEHRLAPASVFVVPLTVIPDGAHFHTLASAVAAAGTSGTVTIEPGTTQDPTAVNVTQTGITIQGDPNVPGNILARYDINVLANGVTLTNMNLGNVQMGGGFNTTSITKDLVRNITELTANSGNGGSQITQDTITGTVNLNGNVGTVTGDLISSNTFSSLSPTIVIMTASAGDFLIANQFFGNVPGQTAVQVSDSGTSASPTTVANNTITLFGPASFGISVFQVGTSTAVNVLNNAINTNGVGQGLVIQMNNASLLRALAQGNDFHNNQIGVSIRGDGASTSLTIDLGGGALSSLGGNNFRSFTTTGSTAAAAILLTNTPPGTNVVAQKNIFANAINANTVINDGTHGSATGTGNIDVTNVLTLNRSFVQALYNELLGRTGALSELDAWVTVLNAQGQPAVTRGIRQSPEALGRIVDTFYLRFLGRVADQAGRAGWINFLINGNTIEAMTTAFTTTPEYVSHINTDYVQSLYINILGRTGSSSELAAWNNALPTIGLNGVANGFSNSIEYRKNYIISFYQTFLHRTPSAGEVSGVSALTGSILDLQLFILNSNEYFTNG